MPAQQVPAVPAATGKLIICAAKMNTAVRPASGAVRSSSAARGAHHRHAEHRGGEDEREQAHRRVDESVGHMHREKLHDPQHTWLAIANCSQ